MNNKAEKEIMRRSKVRSKKEYDILYLFLKKRIKSFKENAHKYRFFFCLYPENKAKCIWTYKVRNYYMLVCFGDEYMYEAMKLRLKEDGVKIRENDSYHFFYKKTS